MAEQEVIKHTKAVYKVWKKPGSSLRHKLTETLWEIVIIVFAITLSLWLHNWSEQRHTRQQEKDFLQGLKLDLQQDLAEMQADKDAYQAVANGLRYFSTVTYGAAINNDSLQKYMPVLYNTTRLNVNNSRFEGLKASGKIDIIEGKDLQNAILELYQEDIPMVNYLNENFNIYKKQRLEPFLDAHLDLDDHGTGNWEQVLRMPEMRNQIRRSPGIKEIIHQYEKVMDKNRKIISMIEKS